MRHFRLTGTVAALARGMGMAAARARLIALSGRAQGTGTGDLGTATGAVALAAIAAAADEYRCAAAGTKVASSRRFHWQERPMALDRIGQWVKYFPRNVARPGTGRDIG